MSDPTANGDGPPEPTPEQIQAHLEAMFANPAARPVRYGLTRIGPGWQLMMQTPESSTRYIMTRDEMLAFADAIRAGVREGPALEVAPPGMRIKRSDGRTL